MRIKDWLIVLWYRVTYCTRYGHQYKEGLEWCANCGTFAGPLSPACLRGDCRTCDNPVECCCGHHSQDAAKAADALAAHLGPDEQGFGEEA